MVLPEVHVRYVWFGCKSELESGEDTARTHVKRKGPKTLINIKHEPRSSVQKLELTIAAFNRPNIDGQLAPCGDRIVPSHSIRFLRRIVAWRRYAC